MFQKIKMDPIENVWSLVQQVSSGVFHVTRSVFIFFYKYNEVQNRLSHINGAHRYEIEDSCPYCWYDTYLEKL